MSEKKKTAMQELIERLKGLQNRGYDDAGIRTAIDIATELLQKEREQIEKAFEVFRMRGFPHNEPTFDFFFTQTYNQ